MSKNDNESDEDKDDDSWRGPDQVNRASCGHMVQSNGTCGDASCSNYGGN